MKHSTIKHIDFESTPINTVLRGKSGDFGIYYPKLDPNGSPRDSLMKFTAQAKSRAARIGVKCRIETLLVISNNPVNDTPIARKIIKVERL